MDLVHCHASAHGLRAACFHWSLTGKVTRRAAESVGPQVRLKLFPYANPPQPAMMIFPSHALRSCRTTVPRQFTRARCMIAATARAEALGRPNPLAAAPARRRSTSPSLSGRDDECATYYGTGTLPLAARPPPPTCTCTAVAAHLGSPPSPIRVKAPGLAWVQAALLKAPQNHRPSV